MEIVQYAIMGGLIGLIAGVFICLILDWLIDNSGYYIRCFIDWIVSKIKKKHARNG